MTSKNRFIIMPTMFAFVLMFMLAGCSKDKDNDDDNNNINPTEIEPLINAGVMNSGNPVEATGISVGIVDANHQGAAITNAIVKVNNLDIPHLNSGSYTLLLTSNPIAPGSTVALEIQCGGETYTASAVMPATESTQVPIPGCAAGSVLTLGHN